MIGLIIDIMKNFVRKGSELHRYIDHICNFKMQVVRQDIVKNIQNIHFCL